MFVVFTQQENTHKRLRMCWKHHANQTSTKNVLFKKPHEQNNRKRTFQTNKKIEFFNLLTRLKFDFINGM